MIRAPKILVFDSGLGGLTVLRALLKQRPDAQFVYTADDLGFPYGPKSEVAVMDFVLAAMERLIDDHAPDCVVVACNTASTLVLPHLRARWPETPFVGTVPAIKPAAEHSQSRLVSILATPGTVARDYTRDLIEKFAGHCEVALVGSQKLAGLAEAFMHGESVADDEIFREIAPCFVARDGRRTDSVVLACTHYPLLLDFFTRLAPWPVHWIDPAPAIARRADHVLSERFPIEGARCASFDFRFTSGAAPTARLTTMLEDLQNRQCAAGGGAPRSRPLSPHAGRGQG